MNHTKFLTYGYALSGVALIVYGVSRLLYSGCEIGDANTQWQLGSHAAGYFFLGLALDGALLLGLSVLGFMGGSTGITRQARPIWPEATAASERDVKYDRLSIGILCLLIGLAVVLRLPMLNSDLWIDEVLTLVNYLQSPIGDIASSFKDDNQHLLFSVLARLSMEHWGPAAWAIRLPALVFGIASLWSCYVLARYVFSQPVALVSVILMTISFHHVWYSQNARGYTMLLFGTLMTTFWLLKAIRSNEWKYWLLAAVAIAFSAMSHLTGVFVAMGQAMVVAVILLSHGAQRQVWWAAIACFTYSALITFHGYSLALPDMLGFFLNPADTDIAVATQWRSPFWAINEVFAGFGVPPLTGWIFIAASGLSLIFITYRFQGKRLMFILLATVPAGVLGLVMILLDRNIWPRLFFNFGGFASILIACALILCRDQLVRFLPGKSKILGWLPVVLIVGYMGSGLQFLYKYPKQDFTGAREYLLLNIQDGDQVVGIHMAGKVYSLYYEPRWPVVNTLAELEPFEAEAGNTWVVYTLKQYLASAKPDLYSKFESQYELMKKFPGTLGDGALYVMRSINEDAL